MTRFTLNNTAFAIGLSLLSAPVFAEVIAKEDFDGGAVNLSGSTNVFDYAGGAATSGPGGAAGDVFGRVSSTLGMPFDVADDTVVSVSDSAGEPFPTDTLGLAGQNTTSFFAMNDMDGTAIDPAITNASWVFDISGATSISDIQIDLAGLGDFEASSTDGFLIEARIDANTFVEIFKARTNEAEYKVYRPMDNGTTIFEDDDPLELFIDGSTTPVGFLDKSDPTTGNFDTYTSTALSGQSGATLEVRVSYEGTPSGSEPMGLDNITINGTAGSSSTEEVQVPVPFVAVLISMLGLAGIGARMSRKSK